MKILIVGTGGVGGYFGGRLIYAYSGNSSVEVHCIARSAHLNQIRNNGLVLDCEDGVFTVYPTSVTDDITSVSDPDLILLCVKSYSLAAILPKMASIVSENTTILPLLNGVDIGARIRAEIVTGKVLQACVYVGTHIKTPGVIYQRGGNARILVGPDPVSGVVDDRITAMFSNAGIAFEVLNEIRPEIWGKFIFIAAFGLVTAVHSVSIGELLESPEQCEEVKQVMQEIVAVGRKEGVVLEDAIVTTSFQKGGSFPFDTRTSFQRDYETAGKKDERDLFGGTILRLAKQHQVAVPHTSRLYAALDDEV